MAHYDVFKSKVVLSRAANNIPRVWLQHAGACSACLSAFAVGTALGWSSLAGPQYLKGVSGFPVSEKDNSLIGSLLTIGAAISCFPTGCVADKIGRKLTLLSLIPIFMVGWLLLLFAESVAMIYAGRFLLGICTGAVCVVAPMYTVEICQKEIRGALGSYFQLLLAGGILFAYVVGSILKLFWFSLICALVPVVFGIFFIYFPESQIYYLIIGDRENARKSLKFFRGADYNIEPELNELSICSDKKLEAGAAWATLKSTRGIRSLLMSIGMMIFQQLSGINAFVFNATNIFENTGSSLDSKSETIIIGVTQVVGTLFVTFLVDRIGRIMLLGISALSMAACTFCLGTYFYLKENDYRVDDFSWVPLLSLCFFIFMFSVGLGAVPWMLMPELMPSEIKGRGTSIACITNWMTAFLVTEFFSSIINRVGQGVTFWAFSVVSVAAAIFTYTILPETNGKSFEEIQMKLSSKSSPRR